MLSNEQIQLIKQSWSGFRQIDPLLVGEVFYTRLFADHPDLRLFFENAMDEQYCRFVNVLNTVIARLDRPGELAALLLPLGLRHRQYGVRAEDYAAVGQALFWTLQSGLGRGWTPELAEAWELFYQWVVTFMLRVADNR